MLGTAPQRSRRLSASGINSTTTSRRGNTTCLKEADAFQRLVYEREWVNGNLVIRLKEADAFQRLVLKRRAAGMALAAMASKKQTPFSVWYAVRLVRVLRRHRPASKKQTPFSVWY